MAQFQANVVGTVCGQHAGATAVGDDGQALAHRTIARSQALHGREQFGEGTDAHGTTAAQCGIKHLVAAHNGGRMRASRHVAGLLAARLEHHHRLGDGGSAQRAHEIAGILDAFQIHHDAVRLRIGCEEVQRLRHVHCSVRAERDHGGEAHLVGPCPVQQGRGQCA